MCEQTGESTEISQDPVHAAIKRGVVDILRQPGVMEWLRQKLTWRIGRYPARDYIGKGHWEERDLEERFQLVLSSVFDSERAVFMQLAGVDARRLSQILFWQIRKVMIANATPSYQAFYREVVEVLRHDPKKRFFKQTFARKKYLGLRAWLALDIAPCHKTREELVNFWRSRINFPNMANGEEPGASEKLDLFFKMLDLVQLWVYTGSFYKAWKKLVNFPEEKYEGNLTGAPKEEDETPDWLEWKYTHANRIPVGIEQRQRRREILGEHNSEWEKQLDRITGKLSPEQRLFLYFYYNGLESGEAAKKVRKAPAFATQTFDKIARESAELRKTLNSDESYAFGSFLKSYLIQFGRKGVME